MKAIVGCERSGNVRRELEKLGWDAWSCDLEDADDGSPKHLRMDVFEAIREHGPFDLGIFHPPCTYLGVSGNRWFSDDARARPGVLVGAARREARDKAVQFAIDLYNCDIPAVALENPVSRLSTLWRRPNQTIQPWQFWDGAPGMGEVKRTCLWLRGLPRLVPTTPYETGRIDRIFRLPPGPERARLRSETFPGVARAMAEQWAVWLTRQRWAA